MAVQLKKLDFSSTAKVLVMEITITDELLSIYLK